VYEDDLGELDEVSFEAVKDWCDELADCMIKDVLILLLSHSKMRLFQEM
jgi:hypothetical protein